MITDASAIPSSTAGNAFLNFMPSSAASREPVHAPVPGSGIPTNNTSPQNSYFSTCSRLLKARASIFSTMGRKVFVCLSQLKIGVINSRMNGTGIIFLPKDEKEQAGILIIMIDEIEREGLKLMHLRNVPTNPNCLGKDARATDPDIKQVFITGVTDVENLERTLYVIR